MTFSYPTDDDENRVRGVVDSLVGTEDADDVMMKLIGVLNEGGKVPSGTGKYYTFFYSAVTPGEYDEYPLVGVTDIFSWGFRGINFHWGDRRQYNYNQIVGGLYEVYPEEMSDVIELGFTKIRSK